MKDVENSSETCTKGIQVKHFQSEHCLDHALDIDDPWKQRNDFA